jgi:hypothetical protein
MPGAQPRVEHLSGASLLGNLQALLANIRLGWNSLPETNTLAYYEHSSITDVKSFITSVHGANDIKHFHP